MECDDLNINLIDLESVEIDLDKELYFDTRLDSEKEFDGENKLYIAKLFDPEEPPYDEGKVYDGCETQPITGQCDPAKELNLQKKLELMKKLDDENELQRLRVSELKEINLEKERQIIRERCSSSSMSHLSGYGDSTTSIGGGATAGGGGTSLTGGVLSPVTTLTGHVNDVTSVDFAGRSLLATGSCDKSVRLYKWGAGDHFTEVGHSPLLGHRYAINAVTFSPYGTKLASAGTDGLTIIWDVKSGERLCVLQPCSEPGALRVCAFSPNSSFLATGGDDDNVTIWDVSTLALLRKKGTVGDSLIRHVGGHEASVSSVCFTPDSAYLASGCSGGELRLWDARYGHAQSLAVRQEAHDLGVSTLHFSPAVGGDSSNLLSTQYLLATGGQDTDLHLWRVQVGGGAPCPPGAAIDLYHTLVGHGAPIMAVRFSPNGTLLASASGDKTVRLWDPTRMCPVCVLDGHRRYVTSCAFSDDSSLLAAGSGDKSVTVWRVDDVAALAGQTVPVALHTAVRGRVPSHLSFRENKKVSEWTGADVCAWLAQNGLAEYSHSFRSHAIDGRELLTLTEDTLRQTLGMDALGHRNKVLRLTRRDTGDGARDSDSPPAEYLCPITQELIVDPVICADGFTYERQAMEAWFASSKRTSPMTNEVLAHRTLTPNRTLRTLIQRYREEHI